MRCRGQGLPLPKKRDEILDVRYWVNVRVGVNLG